MKNLILILALTAVILAGCKKETAQPQHTYSVVISGGDPYMLKFGTKLEPQVDYEHILRPVPMDTKIQLPLNNWDSLVIGMTGCIEPSVMTLYQDGDVAFIETIQDDHGAMTRKFYRVVNNKLEYLQFK